MEEDVLGPREEVVGDRYTRCARCGQVVPIAEVTVTQAEAGAFATEGVPLCRECRRAIESGEADWPAVEEEEAP